MIKICKQSRHSDRRRFRYRCVDRTPAGRKGASVVVADRNEANAAVVAMEIVQNGGIAVPVYQDVSDARSVEASVAFTLEQFGALHLAVNNAGIGGGNSPLANYSPDDWHNVIAVNLNGVFYSMKYQLPALLRSGGGSIVNVASILGTVSRANFQVMSLPNMASSG